MSKNQIHRALVLQGGGTLGAYEAGVLLENHEFTFLFVYRLYS
jgi:predicted acylesterase/phospholipase RssA